MEQKRESPTAIRIGLVIAALIVLAWLPVFAVWRAKRRIGQWWRGENPEDWPPVERT